MNNHPTIFLVTTVEVTHKAFLLPFARALTDKGWTVEGVAAGFSDPGCFFPAGYAALHTLPWSRNPCRPFQFVRAIRKIHEIARKRCPLIVHVHTPVDSFITRFALRKRKEEGRTKVIYTAHGFHFHQNGHPFKNFVFLGLEKLAGLWTDYLVVINQEDEAAAKRYRIVPPERVRYMPGIGIDLDQYRADRIPAEAEAALRHELGLRPAQPLLMMVAEFIPRKRHKDAIRALALLERKDVVLAFAGDGPLRPAMERLAESLGLQKQVRFLGFRADVPVLIRTSLATLLPSEREGLARSVMESMALGVPVIGADARGIRGLLQQGAGLIVPVGDTQGLARAMDFLLAHPEEARRMGEHGRQEIQRYDLSHILRLHEALYAAALCVD